MLHRTPYALALILVMGGAYAVDDYADMAPEEILQALIDETGSNYLNQSPQNQQMMPDNPAYWIAEEGEELEGEEETEEEAEPEDDLVEEDLEGLEDEFALLEEESVVYSAAKIRRLVGDARIVRPDREQGVDLLANVAASVC